MVNILVKFLLKILSGYFYMVKCIEGVSCCFLFIS